MTVSGVCEIDVRFSRPMFTGKERDTESGNDYFGARYYASSMGRFMSPDWSAKVTPVPYAKLGDPQSLNLYSYVGNNPLRGIDVNGHVPCSGSANITIVVGANGSSSMSQSTDDCPGLNRIQEMQYEQLRDQQLHRFTNPWQGHTFAQQVFQGPGSGSFVGANTAVNYAAAGYAALMAAGIGGPAVFDYAMTSIAESLGAEMATANGTNGVVVGQYLGEASEFSYQNVAAANGMNAFNLTGTADWGMLNSLGYGQVANDAFINAAIESGQTIYTSSVPWTGGYGYVSEMGLLSNAGVETVPMYVGIP